MRALRIISGPPGAGKTTVAKLMTTSYSRAVHIHADDFWSYITAGFVEPWLPGSAGQNLVVIKAVASAAGRFVDGGYATVVDTVIGPWLLDPFREMAARRGIGLDYIVLRPHEETALQRATTRQHGLEEEHAIRRLSREFAQLGQFESHVVDSTALTPKETVRAVREGLLANRFRLD